MLKEEITLNELLERIKPTNKIKEKEAENEIDGLLKPPKSLGKLEEIAVQIASITESTKNILDKKAIIVFASDNGIVEENVASAPKEFTLVMTNEFLKGTTGVSSFCEKQGTYLRVVDVGIDGEINNPKIINKKINYSTKNFLKEPAMTRKDAINAILIGIEQVKILKEEGYNIIGVGEMGIGNTTSSSCVLSGLLGVDASKTVGKGAGLDNEAFNHKIEVVNKALKLNKPNPKDPIDVVAKVGGYDIACMCGAYLGCAIYKLPCVMDGFISAVALLLASRLNETVLEYSLSSHYSMEPGFKLIMEEIGKEPYLHLNMRLGEGSGIPLAFDIIDYALLMQHKMGKLSDILALEEYNRKKESFEF